MGIQREEGYVAEGLSLQKRFEDLGSFGRILQSSEKEAWACLGKA